MKQETSPLVSGRLERSPRGRSAQAMVEFALALPILLLVVYGLLETGRYIFTYSAVATAARDAVRYASANGLISSDPTNKTMNYQDCAGIRNAARKVGYGLRLFDDNQIQIAWDGPTRPTPVTTLQLYCVNKTVDPSVTLDSGDRVWVQVNTQFTVLLPLVPFNSAPVQSGWTARTFMGRINLAPTPTNTPPGP